ncbi:MAG TPA: histidine kinase [Clostridiales bacterium]|nr:histidine kinase [Clostridiales bacterium]
MKKNHLSHLFNSISWKLISRILIFMLPLIVLLIYNNFQSQQTLLSQVRQTHQNMLHAYAEQMNGQLSAAMSYTFRLAFDNNDCSLAANSTDEATVQYAKIRLRNSLAEQIPSGRMIDGYFIRLTNHGQESFMFSNNIHALASDRNAILNYLNSRPELLSPNLFSERSAWKLYTIEGTDYLLHLNVASSNICIGAYINMSRLLTLLTPSGTDAYMIYIWEDGLESQHQKLTPGMVLLTAQLDRAPLLLGEVLAQQEIIDALPFVQKYTLLISILLILLVPILLLLTNNTVSRPLKRLTIAMGHIQDGDLDYRIPLKQDSNEFQLVNSTFNSMVSQIQGLKIGIYEEQLKVQRSQLNNLQLQIKPHFLINSLNMVYNLMVNQDNALARKLIVHYVDYFRYMIKIDADFVPLGEEASHVRIYLEIQSIRYQNKFTYSIDIDHMIGDILIPPALIQNFVENSIKYAFHMADKIHITVSVQFLEIDYYPYAKIIISDTGNGYPTELLPLLNEGRKIIDSEGSHTGIRNSIQRLKILFEGKARWHFYNNHGAVCEIIIPAKFDDPSL